MKFTGLPLYLPCGLPWRSFRIFREQFNTAIGLGVKSVPEVQEMVKGDYPGVDLNRYFTENISYILDESKRQGMARFLELATGFPKSHPDDTLLLRNFTNLEHSKFSVAIGKVKQG